ncbi:MAG: YhdP family protein [Gammaproteobacteria bacterium]|nr:YhdP family protein [Gammaproteobacteria bacterium]
MMQSLLNKQNFSAEKIRWYLFVSASIILILFVILMGLLRLALPYLTSYEDEIKSNLQAELNHPVTFSRLDAGWYWFSPQLKLINLDVLKNDKKTKLIHFEEVVFEFDVIASVLNFKLEPSVVSLNGTLLDVKKDKKGTLYLQGFELSAEQSATGNSAVYDKVLSLLDDKELRLVNTTIHWTDQTRDLKLQRYNNLSLSVQVDDSDIRLDIETEVPDKLGKKVHLIANIEKLESYWLSELYINAEDIKLAPVMSYFELHDITASSQLNTELWMVFKNLRLEKITGNVSALDLNITGNKKVANKTWSSRRVTSTFLVELQKDDWSVVVDDLSVALENKQWNDVYFSLKYKASDNSLDARFGYLDLNELSNIVGRLPLNADWVQKTLALNPKGELSKTALHIDDWNKTNSWVLRTHFNSFGLTIPDQGIRLDGLSGSLRLDKNDGELKVNSQAVIFDSKFFNKPLNMSRLIADIDIKKLNGDYQFSSDSVVATLDGVEVQSRIKYETGKKPFLDFQVAFSGANAGWFNSHRTDQLFGKNVAEWLSNSILDGEFTSAGIMYHGYIKDFPFQKNEGVFQSMVKVEKGRLKYHPEWPEISDIDARFFMENMTIVVDGAAGRINKNTVIKNSLTTIKLKADTHVLVEGNVSSNTKGVDDFFTSTPLKKAYLDRLKYVLVDGKLESNLSIDIPLNLKKEKVSVSGNVVLNNNKISVKGLGYTINQVNGVVDFDQAKIDSKNLTGIFNGNRVAAQIETTPVDSVIHTLLTAQLESDVASLVPSEIDVNDLSSGQANWFLELGFPHSQTAEDKILSLNLNSDLAGIEFKLPQPFIKNSLTAADFKLGVDIYSSSTALLLHYDEKLNMAMRWNQGFQQIRSDIQVFNGPVQSIKNGVNITARVKDIDVKEWQSVALTMFGKSNKQGSWGENINIDLTADRLQYGLYKINAIGLNASLDNELWSADVSSLEVVGKINIPRYLNNDVPFVMDFSKLNLSSLLDHEEDKAVGQSGLLQFSPADIPPLKIQARDFTFKDYTFNEMSLVTSQTSYGLAVHAFEVKGESLDLKLKGNWFRKQNLADNSSFRIEIDSDDVGRMLSFYNFSRSIKNGSGNAVIDWQWPASPLDFDWKLVTGRMQLDLVDGQFVDVDPGAGRLLGMFSLRALPKRFFLDFSDTFSQGFEFNTIKSNANFSRGHLYTSKTHLAGDSADVYFRGRIGLADKDYDQIMSVIPRISSGVSGWIAVAQGAVVGLTAYIGQKLLGVDEAAKNQYHISGSWSDPVIKKMGETIDEGSSNNNEND